MNYAIKITNAELYNEKVVDVELDFHKGGMKGDVAIELEEVGERLYSGEHGTHDYEDDYGFVITPQKYMIFDSSSEYMKYLSDGDDFIGDRENTVEFDSEEEAEQYIDDMGWNDWAGVIEKY